MTYYQNLSVNLKRIALQALCCVAVLNEKTVNRDDLFSFCLSQIRLLMFEVRGNCQHSGHCCKHIQIRYSGKWIDDKRSFENAAQSNPILLRFQPVMYGKYIDYFNCSCLSPSNLCLEYASRPKFCQQYPNGIVVTGDYLHPGCGYTIVELMKLPSFCSEKLRQEIGVFKYNNRVTSE